MSFNKRTGDVTRRKALAGCGKKGLSAACSLSLVSPRRREVRESSHLLSRVRNLHNCIGPQRSFFRTLLGAVAIVLVLLVPEPLFAFEAPLETEVGRLSAGPKTSGSGAPGNAVKHAAEPEFAGAKPGTPAHLRVPQARGESEAGIVNPGGEKRLRPGQHLSFVGDLPALPSGAPISLKDFLTQVEHYNLDLAAQQLSIPIAQAQATAARVYPDPVLGGLYGADLSHRKQPSPFGVGLGQTILLGGKVAARAAMADSALEQNKAQFADLLRNLRAEAAGKFVDALADSLVVRFHYQALRRAEDLLDPEVAPRFANKALRINLLRAHIAVLAQRDALLTAQSSLQQELFDLMLLTGRKDPVLPRGDLNLAPRHFVLERLVTGALATRADVQAARRALEGAQAQLQLVKANRWPDLTLQGNYAHFTRSTNLVDPSPPWDAAFVELSIPLPVSNLNTGQLEASHTAELQTARILRAIQLRAETEIRKAFERYSIALDRVHQYTQELLADAEEVYTVRKQQGPSATLLEILDVQNSYNEVYLGYFGALNEQAQALIDLERVANIWDIAL